MQQIFNDNLRILVTGAGGFVGKNLTEFLSSKYFVIGAGHNDLELTDENAVKDFIKRNKINFIIHCANIGGSRKTVYDQGSVDVVSKNLRMFFNLARCLTSDMRMIHFGSGAEYDRRNYQPKMSEDFFDTYVPEDDYGYSKYIMSKYIRGSENIVGLRIFGLYGKYEDYKFKFISNAIVKNLIKLPILINQNVMFDYLYINDFLNIVEKFINIKPKRKIYNITPEKSIDIVSAANIINEISNFKSEIIIVNDSMNRAYSGNNSLIMDEISPFKFTSYEDGIQNLYNYYKTIIQTIDFEAIKEDPFLKFCKSS